MTLPALRRANTTIVDADALDARRAATGAAWQTMQRSHAVANGCFVVAVNRVGHEVLPGSDAAAPGIEFWGGSFVADPGGQIMVHAGRDDEILVADCDLLTQQWPG